jgi:hypothetical protein
VSLRRLLGDGERVSPAPDRRLRLGSATTDGRRCRAACGIVNQVMWWALRGRGCDRRASSGVEDVHRRARLPAALRPPAGYTDISANGRGPARAPGRDSGGRVSSAVPALRPALAGRAQHRGGPVEARGSPPGRPARFAARTGQRQASSRKQMRSTTSGSLPGFRSPRGLGATAEHRSCVLRSAAAAEHRLPRHAAPSRRSRGCGCPGGAPAAR